MSFLNTESNMFNSNPFTNPFDANGLSELVELDIRVDPGRGRKKVTTISGFKLNQFTNDEMKKHSKKLKGKLACGSTLSQTEEDYVITFQGDHREEVKQYVIDEGITTEENIKVHG